MQILIGLICGLIFGFGLIASAMVNPTKVVNFLDIAGSWDLSLAFVMGTALLTAAIGFRIVFKRDKPLLADGFSLPTKADIDGRLLGGSALFGIGWGLSGYCPGPAIAGIALGEPTTIYFLIALVVGMLSYEVSLGGGLKIGKPKAADG